MDAARINRALARLASEIVEENHGARDLYLVGVQRRGVPSPTGLADKNRDLEDTARRSRLYIHTLPLRPPRSGGETPSQRTTCPAGWLPQPRPHADVPTLPHHPCPRRPAHDSEAAAVHWPSGIRGRYPGAADPSRLRRQVRADEAERDHQGDARRVRRGGRGRHRGATARRGRRREATLTGRLFRMCRGRALTRASINTGKEGE